MRFPHRLSGLLATAAALLILGSASQLSAQLQITASRTSITGGSVTNLRLATPFWLGAHDPNWQWTLEGAQGGQLLNGSRSIDFLAPKVQVPTTFQVRVTDVRNALNTAVRSILVRPNLSLTTATPMVISEGRAELRMMRGQEEIREPAAAPSPFLWDVLQCWSVPHGEAVQRRLKDDEMNSLLLTAADYRTTFVAPSVLAPTRFLCRVQEENFPGDLAEVEILVQPAVTIKPLNRLKQTLLAGDSVRLEAMRWDGEPGDWDWDAAPGNVVPDADGSGKGTYTAGQVQAATTVHIDAYEENTGKMGSLELHILPRIKGLPDTIADTIMTAQMGQNWMAPTPSMYPFAGAVAPLGQGLTPVFKNIGAIAFVDDPALAGLHLHRKWLVADQLGIQVLPSLGKTATPLAGARGTVTALAVRPGRASLENQRHVVFALEQEPLPWRPLAMQAEYPGACILHLGPSGAIQLLAGTLERNLGGTAFQDGPGPAARFGKIRGLAMDGRGTVFVADAGNRLIRSIRPDGTVTTLAGNPTSFGPQKDGHGAGASFQDLRAMTLDPASQDLYVADGRLIRKVTRAGEVTTLADLGGAGAMAPPSLGLSCLGNNLFIADAAANAIRYLDLTSLNLKPLAGNPQERVTRMGPLGAFATREQVEKCAALANPTAVATNTDGMCVVALNEGLVQLDLDTLDPRAWARRFKQKTPAAAAAPSSASAPPASAAAAAASHPGKRKGGADSGPPQDPSEGSAAAASSSSAPAAAKRQRSQSPIPK